MVIAYATICGNTGEKIGREAFRGIARQAVRGIAGDDMQAAGDAPKDKIPLYLKRDSPLQTTSCTP